MANIEYFHDDCQTAADVMAKAHEVREKRRAAFAKPQVIYIREPSPEPETKYILHYTKPSIIQMMHEICDHFKIEQLALMEIVDNLATKTGTIAIHHIQKSVAVAAKVHVRDLVSARRTNDVLRPRHIAMAMCKRLTNRSLPEIARRFNRDHTTVRHAVRKLDPLTEHVDKLLTCDASVNDWATLMVERYDEILGR